MTPELVRLRDALPAARAYRYVNYAATGPIPSASAEAMADAARRMTEPLGEQLAERLAALESARASVASLIGAQPEEVAWAANTSTALSMAAMAVRWKPGDRVLYPADDFPSNRYVWQNLAEWGVRPEPVSVAPGSSFVDSLAGRSLSGVRLVACSAVSYRDGRREDVVSLAERCRAEGSLLAVDAVQAVGAVPVDARSWGCDFLACGGQKWLLGPVGSGFLYIARHRLEELRVPLVGWASSRRAGEFDVPQLEFCGGARRFEPGLPDLAAIAGLAASLALLAKAGWLSVFGAIAAHQARLRAALAGRGLRVVHDGPPESVAGIVTVEFEREADADALAEACRHRRILLTHRGRLIRIAPHAATSDSDLDACLELLPARGQVRSRQIATDAAPVSAGASSHRPTRPDARAPWRLAVVTGAGRGLGEGIAVALARRGCGLILIGRDGARLSELSQRLGSEFAVDCRAVSLDLSDAEALARWIDQSRQALAGCDALVNNAAQAEAELGSELDPARLRAMVEVNFLAPVLLTRAVVPGMMQRRWGSVLNVVTSGARCALPLFAGYAASKAALWAFGESLGRELAGSGVRVTTFVPPHMATATQRQLSRSALAHYAASGSDGQLARPHEVGELAVQAMLSGRGMVMPRAVRLRLAVNTLAPEWIGHTLSRRFQAGSRRSRSL